MKVWVLEINGEAFEEAFDGQYLKLFSTEEKAKKHLAEWCRKMWRDDESLRMLEELEALGDIAENDDDAIDGYFSFWDEERYSIEAIEVE